MRHAFPLLHRVQQTEIYYLLSGAGTLVTGGELIDSSESPNNPTSVRGSGIAGGVSRRIAAGDVVVIPGATHRTGGARSRATSST